MQVPQEELQLKIALSHVTGISRKRLGRFLENWIQSEGTVLKPAFWSWLSSQQAISVKWDQVAHDAVWCKTHACHILMQQDPEYPEWLRHISDPPLLLYVQGNLSLLSSKIVAIVGSRQPSPSGEELAFYFAKSLAEAGLVIASGLALGIDGAAHRGALSVDTGVTIAVLGSGLASLYPQRHVGLARSIQTRGVLVTEYAPHVGPYPPHFPQRNRIISGLAQGVLVVEAGLRSGSLITARLALEQNREVMAIPGSLGNAQSQGTHRLIQEGALLITEPKEVLEALQWPIATAAAVHAGVEKEKLTDELLDKEMQQVLHYVGFDCTSIEAIVHLSGLAVELVSSKLIALDLLGKIQSVEGGYVQRVVSVGGIR